MRYLAAHAQIHKYNTHIWAACALAINNLPEWELSRASTPVQRATAGEVGGALGGALQLQHATAGPGALQWGQEDWGPGRWQSGRHGFHTFHMHRPPLSLLLLLPWISVNVWTGTRDELTLLFTRAQQAQNDKYKKILITLIGTSWLKLTFRTFDQVQNIDILQRKQ